MEMGRGDYYRATITPRASRLPPKKSDTKHGQARYQIMHSPIDGPVSIPIYNFSYVPIIIINGPGGHGMALSVMYAQDDLPVWSQGVVDALKKIRMDFFENQSAD